MIQKLAGGTWNGSAFVLSNGRPLNPNTADWASYLGDVQVQDLQVLFPRPGSWDAAYGWLNKAASTAPPGAVIPWSKLQFPQFQG